MTGKHFLRDFVPILILIAGNGVWAICANIYKVGHPAVNTDHVDLMVSYGYSISVLCILYFLYYRKGFGSIYNNASLSVASKVLVTLLLSAGFFLTFSGGLGLLSLAFPDAFLSYQAGLMPNVLARNPFLWIYSILLAPAVEEFCFRGLSLSNFTKSMNFAAANVLQALFFAIIHASFVQIAYAFLMGLILGYLCKCYGTRYCFVFHALFNALNLPLILWLGNVGSATIRYVVFLATGVLLLIAIMVYSKLTYKKTGR